MPGKSLGAKVFDFMIYLWASSAAPLGNKLLPEKCPEKAAAYGLNFIFILVHVLKLCHKH